MQKTRFDTPPTGTTDKGLVLVHFGKPTAWFGMPPQAAYDLAKAIMHHARTAAVASGVTILDVDARAPS